MKITKIEKHKDYPVCDNLLEHGYYSDSLFDKCFIEITVNIDDNCMAPIYRKLWEDIYIKINGSVTRFSDTHELIVGITVSEALGFIYKATPPRFQKNIEESHKSVEDIIKSLNTFLIGDNAYIAFSDMFFEFAHLKNFHTQWQNFDKIKAGADLITSLLPRGCMYGFYVYASTEQISDLAAGKDNNELYASTTMICSKIDTSFVPGVIKFCKDVLFADELGPKDDSFKIKVDNVHIENGNVYVGLLMCTDATKGAGTWTCIPKPYSAIIKNSYENVK